MDKPTRFEINTEMAKRRFAGLVLRGHTAPVRQQLREAGAIWDPLAQAWLLPNVQTLLALGAQPREIDWFLPKPPSGASHEAKNT